MEDKNADIKPMPITLLNNPRLEILDNTSAKIVVIPTFFSPNTTRYIPMENKTIFHGAPLMTCFVRTALDLRANNTNIKAIIPAIIDTGMFINSRSGERRVGKKYRYRQVR